MALLPYAPLRDVILARTPLEANPLCKEIVSFVRKMWGYVNLYHQFVGDGL